jgi:uncharacterized repeat protein (TIGR02543 family)
VKLAVRRTSTAIAVFATAGISGLFMGAAPASALANPCGTGTLVSGNICEQVFTSSTAPNFVPPAQTSKLEALLVGGGGAGNVQAAFPTTPGVPATNGYATAGGGGQVKVVDFSASVGAVTPLVVTVGAAGQPVSQPNGGSTTVAGGLVPQTANGGNQGSSTGGGTGGGAAGGTATDPLVAGTVFGGGGGALGAATGIAGGAGVQVSTAYSADTLFASDTNCYGGGGASATSTAIGIAGCGAGAPSSLTASTTTALAANTGGGGEASLNANAGSGSSGIVVFRWFVPTVTLTFAADGHGTAPATENVVQGTAPTKPADPTASGYTFRGWYTDAQLTTLADFSAPLSAATTFYAKWTANPALAATGGGPNQAELPIGIGALAVGAGLVGIAFYRRKRNAN